VHAHIHHSRARPHTHTRAHAHTHTRTHTCTHAHTHTHARAHTNTHTQSVLATREKGQFAETEPRTPAPTRAWLPHRPWGLPCAARGQQAHRDQAALMHCFYDASKLQRGRNRVRFFKLMPV